MRAAVAGAGAGAPLLLQKESLLARLALAAAAGALQAVSIAEPWHGQPLWWLQLASLALFVRLLDEKNGLSRRRAALLGWVFATAWFAATWWWMYVSMHRYGGLPAPLAALAVGLLAAALALYYAAACAIFSKAFGPSAPATVTWRAIVFAALWLLAELARGEWFTGLPWGGLGYAHVEGPFARLAPLVGVYGIAFAAALWAALLALRGPGLVWRAAFALLALAALAGWPQPGFTTRGGALSVSLLQGNIPQNEKFQPGSGIPLALSWYARQLQGASGDLVVAPETAIPLLPRQLPAGYWDSIARRFAETEGGRRQAALIGIPLAAADSSSSNGGYTNSALGLAPGEARPYRYDKHHLVPFGEFVPPLFRWFTRLMNIPLGDFDSGGVGQPSFAWKGQRLAPNICYEDLFGEELGQRFADPGAAPTIFVNLSNIGWFGDTIAIDQHLQLSRMRTLEFERPMIRATNTGATAIIDHRGRLTHELPRYTRGVLTGEVEGRAGNTPYADWVSRLGLWPLWAIALLAPLIAAWMPMRRRRAAGR